MSCIDGVARAAFIFLLTTTILTSGAATTGAAGDTDEIGALRRRVAELESRDAQRERELDSLKEMVRDLTAAPRGPGHTAAAAAAPAPARAPSPQEALDREVAQIAPAPAATGGADAGPAEIGRSEGRPAQRFDATGPGGFGTTGPGTAGIGTLLGGEYLSRQFAGGRLRLIDVSFNMLVAAGGSTAGDTELESLQGGAHDPNRNGFTLQQGELSLAGAVDPYFTGEAHVAFTTDGVELEEAFLTTQSLPWNLQVEAGYFLTEFGRINPTHPHAWQWLDQPVVNTRMFGGDGLRAPGFRLGWIAPLPWYSEWNIGAQNANEGEFTTSFRAEEAVGGRPGEFLNTSHLQDLLYLARTANFVAIDDETTALVGFSGLFGPNSTGEDARTFLYGADLTVKWRPVKNFRGWPYVLWQTEAMKRDYTADPVTVASDDTSTTIPGALLRDWGFYSQLVYGFTYRWSAGFRGEWASGKGQSYPDGREADSLRDDRMRLSPLVIYQPTEYSRFRLQYNYDHALHLPGAHDAHTVWVGAEIQFGVHPAHKY